MVTQAPLFSYYLANGGHSNKWLRHSWLLRFHNISVALLAGQTRERCGVNSLAEPACLNQPGKPLNGGRRHWYQLASSAISQVGQANEESELVGWLVGWCDRP